MKSSCAGVNLGADELSFGHLSQDAHRPGETGEIGVDVLRDDRTGPEVETSHHLPPARGKRFDGGEKGRIRVDVSVGELAHGNGGIGLLGIEQRVVAELGPRSELRVENAPAPRLGARDREKAGLSVVPRSPGGESARSEDILNCRGSIANRSTHARRPAPVPWPARQCIDNG